MRPLNLKISAFGPYAGEIEIPMEKLGSQGIYLITGVTGAGKTTIYDAISFALFGEASGTSREAKMFRSKYAKENVATQVELKFSHGGKEYEIKRNPEYIRPSKHGSGMTTQVADATLYLPNGEIITKVKNVTKAVEEILGINKEQFSQIAMIAQGDFLKLLHANTSERINIFRELFKTGKYQILEKKLDESRREILKCLEKEREGINQYIAGIKVDEDNVLSLKVDKAKKDELLTRDVLLLLEELIKEDKDENKKLGKDIEKGRRELEAVNQKIGIANRIIIAKEKIKKAGEELKKEEGKIGEIEEKYQLAKKEWEKKEGLEKEAHILEAELEKFNIIENLEKEISLIEENLEKEKSSLDNYLKVNEEKRNKLGLAKEELEHYKDIKAELEKLKARLEIKKNEKTVYDEILNSLKNLDKNKEDVKKLQDQYLDFEKEFNKTNEEYEIMDQAFRDGQAGILAQKLKEGMKCPVCGSTSHPLLAKIAENVPTEEELKRHKKKAEDSRKMLNEKAREIHGKRESIKTIEDELLAKVKKHVGIEDLNQANEKIEEALKNLGQETKEIVENIEKSEEKENQKERLKKQVQVLEEEIRENEDKIQELKNAISEKEGSLSEKKRHLDETKKDQKEEDRKKAIERINMLLNKANLLQINLDNAKQEKDKQKTKINDLKKEIEVNKENIIGAEDIELEREVEKQRLLNREISDATEKKEIVSGRLTSNQIIRENIEKKSSNISELEGKYAWMKALADTANGQLSSKEKLKLETYIQTTYFDQILIKANRRLMKMSSNQYELIRLKEAVDTRSQTGLDLGVIDHYNGSRRSVKTLSGGESFMASLSMALGLSDVIQSIAGGIKVESIFIDEGFGSLDPESLDMAYRALSSLTEGSSLVGIISHVADLKAKIDCQIVVKKDKAGGSFVEMVGVL